MEAGLDALLLRIRACRLCAGHLPQEPRPVLVADARARILIAGQAPGTRAQAAMRPWDDPSGERLRDWLGVDRSAFYDPARFALVAMGFCYPGRGRGGDLPPRPECRAAWHGELLPLLARVRLRVVLGRHAMEYHLGQVSARSLAQTVQAWRSLPRDLIALPHPSPRNTLWLRRHPWFEAEVVPELRRRVAAALDG